MVEHEDGWRIFARAPITRRRFIAGSAALSAAVSALAIVGCDDDDASEAESGGTLRHGTSLPIAFGLDPHVEQATGLAIFPKVYGYLLHVDPRDDTTIYDHAGAVEQPDELTYILRLRPDVRFQQVAPVNGRAVEAEDVVQSILRFRSSPLVVNRTWHETILDTVSATDTQTVNVRLHRPSVYTLHELGGIASGAIIPREAIEQGLSIAAAGAGSGPFQIDRVDLDRQVRLVRNETYYGERAHVDAMEWTIYADDDAKVRAFEKREVDVIPNRNQAEARRLADVSRDIEVSAERSLAYLSLGLRVDKPPFGDERIRRAIDLLIDRDELIRELASGEGEILGPVNPWLGDGFWALPREEVGAASGASLSLEDRIAEAKQLLRAANDGGFGFKIQVRDSPDLVDAASLVRDQLARGEVYAVLEPLREIEWFLNFRTGRFDATLISQLPYESPDIPTRLYHSKGIDGSGSTFGFSDPAIDWLVERSWGEADRELRRGTLLDAQRRMLEARPMLQLFTGTGYAAAWTYVRNQPTGLAGSLRRYYYHQWLDDDAPTR